MSLSSRVSRLGIHCAAMGSDQIDLRPAQAINILTKRPMLNTDTITHIKILRLANLFFPQLILSSLFLCFDEALNFPM